MAVGCQALNCNDVGATRLKHWNEAAIYQRSAHQNAARATLALSTAFLRSRQSKLVSPHIQQAIHRVRPHGCQLSIDRERDLAFCVLRRLAHCRPRAEEGAISGTACSASASKIFSGSNGIESNAMCSASSIALTIAGAGPSIGSSPIPFAPYAPCTLLNSSKNTRMSGRSAEVGMM